MEVSGRRELRNLLSSTLRFGSEEDTSLYCHPCDLSGQRVTASGYCQNCREHMCYRCIASHKKATPSRDHVVDISTATALTAVSSDKLPNCTTHEDEEVKLYCRAHATLGCVFCMTLSHKLCEIDYIPEVSERFIKSEEYLTFENSIYDLKEKCALNISKIVSDISSIERTFSDIISAVKETKTEIIDSLDKFEKELEETVADYKNRNTAVMELLKSEYEKVAREIVATDSTTNRMKKDKQFNALFCEVKNVMAKLTEYQSRTYELSRAYCIEECIFHKNPELKTYLTKDTLFGLIGIKDTELAPCSSTEVLLRQPFGKINIKAEDDKNTCYATGLAFLSVDQLAVADRDNKNVKIVDVTYNKMISKIALSSSPRDITLIPPEKLAVTLTDEKIIQLLSTAQGLSKLQQIKTNKNCRGIQYHDEKLIVTFDNFLAEIQILDLKGQVLRMFCHDKAGRLCVFGPKCVALSPDHYHIYVSNNTNLIRFTRSGEDTARYEYSVFMGLVVSSGGSVYACASTRDAVIQLSDDLSNATVVLNETDGIHKPIGLAFSKEKNILYVSCGKGGEAACDKLHTFKIK